MMTAKSTRTRKPAATKATPATPKPEVKTAKPAPTPANCGCGCGQPTVTARATFLAGHDARHAGEVGRRLAVDPTDEAANQAYDRMSDRLKEKTAKIRQTATRAEVAKAAKKAAKAAADKAYADAMEACEI